MHELGIWVEVTTLVIPGLNDSEGELREIARFIKDVHPAIPWHVSAFYPTYQMTDRQPTPAKTLHKARDIGLEEGLLHVYEGNIPGGGGENTYCPSCRSEVISRYGFNVREIDMIDGHCRKCGERIHGVW
jgi:pyruvate formate lyase activating enzyme